jgi:hypothetical protein
VDVEILGSNPEGIDIYTRLTDFCSPALVEALRQADPSSKELYQMSK